MTSGPTAPPLPPPQPPAAAARAVSEAARAAADAWTAPMDPAESGRAISQLHSVLRDLGIATRGLARYRTTGRPADPAPLGFSRLIAVGARHLLTAWESLDGVVAAEGLGPVPDPDEPGAVLCRAARNAITSWRQPAGTSADRDTTVERLITAIGGLSAATQCLITCAPRQLTIELHAADAELAEATDCLTRATLPPPDDAAPRLGCDSTTDGGRLCPQQIPGNPAAVSRHGRCAGAIRSCRAVAARPRRSGRPHCQTTSVLNRHPLKLISLGENLR